MVLRRPVAWGTVNITTTGSLVVEEDIRGPESVTLGAGVNATLAVTSTVSAGTTVTVRVDTDGMGGGILNSSGDIDAILAAFSGNDNDDIFNITPDQDADASERTPIAVSGFMPAAALGDAMNLDITGLSDPALTIGQNANAGRYSFSDAGSVTYTSIESLSVTPVANQYDLIVDLNNAEFNPVADGTLNLLDFQLNEGRHAIGIRVRQQPRCGYTPDGLCQ